MQEQLLFSAEGAGKQGLKGAPKNVPSALVPPNLTERQQLALLLKQTKTESVPAPSESDSEVSDDSDDNGSSSGGDNRRKRKGGHGERDNVKRHRGEGKQTGDTERGETEDRRRGDEKKDDEGKKQIRNGQEGGIRDGEGQNLDESTPSAFGHSGRLPPPIPMPRGMGKRTRVRQRRTGAGRSECHQALSETDAIGGTDDRLSRQRSPFHSLQEDFSIVSEFLLSHAANSDDMCARMAIISERPFPSCK